ncbi:hypothetical protein [Bacteroides sp.]
MKKKLLLAICLMATMNGFAQKKDFSYKFYGQIRTDLYYNSRANKETVDGLFYMYPLDKLPDADGKDLNATANSSFYTLYTRLGIDVAGPKLGNAQTSAKVEVDFRGSGTTFSTVRLRHAYLNLDWGKSALLLGQTWHPLFGDVSPQILNLSVGAPFQPFSRAPQIRYRYQNRNFQLTGAAVWQSQYLSVGPDNVKSQNYIKNSCVPEIYAGIDYKTKKWLIGAGIELLSIKPRTESKVETVDPITDIKTSKTYKVNERITTLSYEAHLKYTNENWFVAAKSILGSNLTQLSMLGGYGISSIDKRTGEQEYSSILNSSSWLNVVYGKKWKPGLFLGYIKNLGTGDAVTKLYGTGTDVDQLVTAGAELTYNVAHWKFGLEYTLSSAWYGSMDKYEGKIKDTHSICNHRIVGVAMFMF